MGLFLCHYAVCTTEKREDAIIFMHQSRRTMNIQKEFESDELRFYLYIFIKIQERFISLNFQEYKHTLIKM